jgi:hypothetical protein
MSMKFIKLNGFVLWVNAQCQDLIWLDVVFKLFPINWYFTLVFFKDICSPGLCDGECSAQYEIAALTLAFIQPHDDAIPIFGALDGFDNDIGTIGGDQ